MAIRCPTCNHPCFFISKDMKLKLQLLQNLPPTDLLIKAREKARIEGEFEIADLIREYLLNIGVKVFDSKIERSK